MASGYHAQALAPDQEQFETLHSWIRETVPDGASVCDVGGGGHFLDFPSRLRPWAGRIVGVDPDAGVAARPWYDEAHQALLEQWAVTTSERFDLVLSVYVLEHVETPAAFLRAARSLLAPGGSMFGITPNIWHYFGLLTTVSMRLGIEERVLRRVRPDALVDAYHFPVRYRMNSLRRLSRLAGAAGFSRSSFRCIEDPGMFVTYFPARLGSFPARYSDLVHRLGRPQLFGTIVFRLDA
ncbi:MAG: class I SAM-dependent methyltransferase [Acidimicrobiales bacterium]